MMIYEQHGFPDHPGDLAILAAQRVKDVAAARSEALAIYAGPAATVRRGRYRVTAGAVRNRATREA